MAKLIRKKEPSVSVKETTPGERMSAPRKLSLLVTVVNRNKAEFYADFLQSFEVNMQLITNAEGTASKETLHYLGLVETDKAVIFSVIREERVAEALAALEQKFKTIKNGKGIAFTTPMTGTVGVAIYQFLSNTQA
ncbi:MAG: hypothetical protein J6D87_06030 [Clostridia bacterium]|nr:hypothetical protein [Clostridia bacterium]MBQ7316208.1 hypothetical protein [Clostridia bacterium]